MNIDKNAEFIKYIRQCPLIDRIYATFSQAEDETRSFVPLTTARFVKQFIDGSMLKHYDFAIIAYNLANFNPVAIDTSLISKNIVDLADLQLIINWIETQNENRNYPNFGDNCEIEAIYPMSSVPIIAGIDGSGLAKYMIQIRCEYIEKENN